MNENQSQLADGVKLIYLHEDAGRVTDTGVYLAPGAENVVTVGTHLNGELAHAFVERGICGVYEDNDEDPAASDEPAPRRVPDMPWLEAKSSEFDPEAAHADLATV